MTARQVSDGGSDGVTVAKTTTIPAGFHGTAVVQAALVTAVSTSSLVLVSGTAYGFATQAQATWLIATVNSMLTALKDKGIISST